MTSIRKTTATTFHVPHGATVLDMLGALGDLPGDAVLSFDHYKGDQREPGYLTLTATWRV